jgi:hypothetical protein
MDPEVVAPWSIDWVWSLPLIVISVAVHVVGLMLIFKGVVDVMRRATGRGRFIPMLLASLAAVSLLATILHACEAAIWAASFRLLGALPDARSAMLYSLSAMTTYGHVPVYLKDRWQLMGAIEALNGMLLFGLTTAFLFAMIREVWDIEIKERQRI